MEEIQSKYEPPEWTKDETMAVLFAPFRESRDVNPSSWDRKLTFWSQLIVNRCVSESTAAFNAKDLPRKFERKGKVPFCLGVIVQELIKKGKLQRLSEFKSGTQKTWAGWTYNFFVKKPVQATFNVVVKKPLSWTYNKLFAGGDAPPTASANSGADSSKGLENEEFVVVEVVKSIGEQILNDHYGQVQHAITDNVVDLHQLRERCQQLCPNSRSFQLALIKLCDENKCTVTETKDGERIVVFASKNQSVKGPISETQIRVYKLHQARDKLHKQIDNILVEMEKCRLEAKHYLQRGMKMSAKGCLKRKKRLDLQQEKKEAAIDNIHHLLSTIQQACTDKQVIDAYSSGVAAFKDITHKYGLTPDMVDDVMLGVQEVLENQEDLEKSISMPVMPDTIGADELEQELADLLDQEGTFPAVPQVDPHQPLIDSLCQMKLEEDADFLPAIPSHTPGTPQSVAWPSQPGTSTPIAPQSVPFLTSPQNQPATRKDQQPQQLFS